MKAQVVPAAPGEGGRAERLALAALLLSAVLGGGNAVAIRFSDRELAPLWGAAVRFAPSALIFLALMALFRLAIPRGRRLIASVLYGAFNFAGSFGLTYWGLQQLHAGLGQTIYALIPLITLLLAVVYRQERLRPAAVLGTVLALAGVGVMSRASLEGAPPASMLALLGGAFCVSQATVLVRMFPRVHPVAMNGVGMTAATILLLGASMLAREPPVLPHKLATWLAIGYLAPIGSVVVFGLYLVVLRQWSASRTAYAFVLIPLVTIPLSAWLDHERVGWGLVLGGVLVVAGVYVGALRASGPPGPSNAPPPPPDPRLQRP